MSSTRDDPERLRDIIQASIGIERIVAGFADREEFFEHPMARPAALHYLMVVGEAASRLTPEIKARHSYIEWRQIVSMRNRIVHAYFDLEWRILWNAALDDLPKLRKQVEAIFTAEFPGQ